MVDAVARTHVLRMASAAHATGAADSPVHPLADGPERIQIVIAVVPADRRHQSPDRRRIRAGLGRARGTLGIIGVIDTLIAHAKGTLGPARNRLAAALESKRGIDGLPKPQEALGDQPAGLGIVGIEVMAQTLDQARATLVGTDVMKRSQCAESPGVSTGTGMIQGRRLPAASARMYIICV